MSKGIVKLADGKFVTWCTAKNSPISSVLSYAEAVSLIKKNTNYKASSLRRLAVYGTTFRLRVASDFEGINQAGDAGECISFDEIIAKAERGDY